MRKSFMHIGLFMTLAGMCSCIEPPTSYTEWDKQRIERLSDAGSGGTTDAGTPADAN